MAINNRDYIVAWKALEQGLVFVFPNGEIQHYDKKHLFTLAGEDKIYTIGAYYGIFRKQLYTKTIMPPNCVEVSLEEFIQNFGL